MKIPKSAVPITIGVLCLVYLAARLWGLTDSCLWFDEIFGVHAAEHSWGGLWWFVAQDLIHPPLFYLLLKIWISIGGEGLFWLRLFPVTAAVLSLYPFLQLCKELKLARETTIAALFLFAVNGAMIKYAQEVRMYGLVLFFSTLSLWLFARFFYRGKSIWMLTLVNVLLVYTHYFGWFVVVCEVGAIVIAQRVKSRHVLLMMAIVATVFMPWIVAIGKATALGSEVGQNIGWIERPTLMSLIDFALDLFEPFYFQQTNVAVSSIYAISIPLLAIIAAAKIIYLSRVGEMKEKSALLLLSTFIVVPVVFAVVLSWLSPFSIWGTRHLTIVFLPTFILAAIYLTAMPFLRVRQLLVAAILVLTICAFVVQLITPKPQFVWCGFDPIGRQIAAESSDGPIYVFEDLAAYHLWFTFRSDAERRSRVFKVEGFPGMTEDKAYFLPRGFDGVSRIDATLINQRQMWLVYRAAIFDTTEPPLAALLSQGYEVKRTEVFDGGISKVFGILVEKRAN